MRRKPFIDRKSAKTYHLVHRSQRDPLIADTEASDRVFTELRKPSNTNNRSSEQPQTITAFDEEENRIIHTENDEDNDRTEQAGEAALCGVYYDDTEYDYTQHLKPIGEDRSAIFIEAPSKKPQQKNGLIFVDEKENDRGDASNAAKKDFHLPAEVLPSQHELPIGLFNQPAVPIGLQPDMDPELREALTALEHDEYVVEEGELDDDFFAELDAEVEESDEVVDNYSEENDDVDELGGWKELERFKRMAAARRGSDDEDDDDSLDGRQTVGSKFSMTSSAMFRNDKLQLLDDRFEKVEKEYMESDSESDDEEGFYGVNPVNLDSVLDEFLDKYDVVGRKMVVRAEGNTPAQNVEAVRRQLGEARIDGIAAEGDEDSDSEEARKKRDEELSEMLDVKWGKERPEWDCQTILTTYTNLENHPSIIRDKRAPRIALTAKGMPRVIAREKKSSEKENDGDEPYDSGAAEDEDEKVNKGVSRPRKETAEEKRARKEAIKTERRDRREVKKATRKAFRSELQRQEQRADQVATAAACTRIH